MTPFTDARGIGRSARHRLLPGDVIFVAVSQSA